MQINGSELLSRTTAEGRVRNCCRHLFPDLTCAFVRAQAEKRCVSQTPFGRPLHEPSLRPPASSTMPMPPRRPGSGYSSTQAVISESNGVIQMLDLTNAKAQRVASTEPGTLVLYGVDATRYVGLCVSPNRDRDASRALVLFDYRDLTEGFPRCTGRGSTVKVASHLGHRGSRLILRFC
jgi:hypothetical protein